MENNFKELEKFIGKEKIDRVLEVMRAFEVKFPESFNIYKRYYFRDPNFVGKVEQLSPIAEDYSYIVSLSKDFPNLEEYQHQSIDNLNYFEFSKKFEWYELQIIIDEIIYKWSKNKENIETLFVKNKKAPAQSAIIIFNQNEKGINSSSVIMKHSKYSSPLIIRSFLTTVLFEDMITGIKKEGTIDEYFDIFKKLLVDEYYDIIPKEMLTDTTLSVITRIFENPINEIIQSVKNDDHNWRYEKEKEIIDEEYEERIANAKEKYEKNMKRVQEEYLHSINDAKKIRDRKLSYLDENKEEYNRLLGNNGVSMH